MSDDNIDRLIAERVMGWTPCTTADHNIKACYWVDSDGSVWLHNGVVPWTPTADANAVVDVIRTMKALGWRWSVEDLGNRYRANFSRGIEWAWRTNREHASPMVATCLSALAAIEQANPTPHTNTDAVSVQPDPLDELARLGQEVQPEGYATPAELGNALRALAAEVAAWRDFIHCDTGWNRSIEAMKATDANPTARAAVDAERKDIA